MRSEPYKSARAEHHRLSFLNGFGFAQRVIREAPASRGRRSGCHQERPVRPGPRPGGRLPLRIAQRPEQLRASVEDQPAQRLGVERLPVVNSCASPRLRPRPGPEGRPGGRPRTTSCARRVADRCSARGGQDRRDRPETQHHPGAACAAHCRPTSPALQNAYRFLFPVTTRDMLRLCMAEGIAWVPFFPPRRAFPGLPKSPRSRAVRAVAQSLGGHALPGRPRLAAAPRPERAAHTRHRRHRPPRGQHGGQRDQLRPTPPRRRLDASSSLQRGPHRLTGNHETRPGLQPIHPRRKTPGPRRKTPITRP